MVNTSTKLRCYAHSLLLMPTLDDLRTLPQLKHVPDDQLTWLLDRLDVADFSEKYTLYEANAPIDHLRLLLEGQINVVGEAMDEVSTFVAPTVMGTLPYSRLTHSTFPLVTDTPVRTLTLHRDHLPEMTRCCYELTSAFVQQMTDRVRDFAQQAQQEEKMASLGRLSAGLAHELNNPVAAIMRNADTLKSHMRATPDRFKQMMQLALTNEQTDAVNEWLFNRLDNRLAPLSMLERSSREDDLTDWLDEHNVPNAADLASSLADQSFSEEDLDDLLAQVGDENLAGVLEWVNTNLITERLVVAIGEASNRMATLVSSIKSYTHMDQGAGKETVRLGEGIQSTLILLGHKVRAKHATVTVDVPDTLPTVQGWPGELNQIWTNLIDNALDALPDEGGTITIRTTIDRERYMLTTVTDNGSGIPDAIQSKIFEPYFSTKGIGKGTGLGLDIVQGLIKHHNGTLKVYSKPGETTFTVCLPVGV